MEVIWSAKAKMTFYKVLDYLNENWTQKEIVQFNQRTQITINAIKRNPAIFPGSEKNKEIRKIKYSRNIGFFGFNFSYKYPEMKIYSIKDKSREILKT